MIERKITTLDGEQIDQHEITCFSAEQEKFIREYFSKFDLHIPPEGIFTKNGLSIGVLSDWGSQPTFVFTDGFGSTLVIKRAELEVAKYLLLPSRVRAAKFLNPIIRVASDHSFYGTPLLTGAEGDAIRDIISMEEYVDRIACLIQDAANLQLYLQDFHFFSGKNIFLAYDMHHDGISESSILMIFDHGSYFLDDAMTAESIITSTLREIAFDVISPFCAVVTEYMFQVDKDGAIRLHPTYVSKLRFTFQLIQKICANSGWEVFPFYKLEFIPSKITSKPRTVAKNLKTPLSFPIPESIADFISLIKQTVTDYHGVRSVIVEEDGATVVGGITISRAEALTILEQHFSLD